MEFSLAGVSGSWSGSWSWSIVMDVEGEALLLLLLLGCVDSMVHPIIFMYIYLVACVRESGC